MNNIFHTLITILLLTFVITVSGVPIRDRFRYSDPDTENRVNKHLNAVSVPMQGGGWPSTTDNPSGGGRWN
jgi:hypothetical protein